MVVEILCVGTEILLGNIVNTNSQFLSEKLAKYGHSMYYQTVVGDNPDRLFDTLKLALSRSDMVITTGGLGPTQDDLTKEIICKCMDKELVEDAKAKEMLVNTLVHMNKISKSNYKQAMVPKDSIVLYNNNGTAPGAIIENNGKTVIMLPGPPMEMSQMFNESVIPYLESKMDHIIHSVTVKMIGIGESKMAELADDLINGENPTAAPYAKTGECQLRITARAKSIDEAKGLIEPVLEEVKKRFAEYIYTCDENDNIEDVIVRLLKEKGLTISFAESCTGGLLAARLVNVPGASEVLSESYITYSDEAKEKVLGVNKETLEKYTAVSKEVALEMARGVVKASGADVGVSVTGYAGPDGGTKENPVGTVFIGISYKGKENVIKYLRKGSRERIRINTTVAALDLVRKTI